MLAREVASATASGGAANLRMEHLQRAVRERQRARVAAERMQAALEAAGLTRRPAAVRAPETVSLRIDRRRAALRRSGGRRSAPPRAEPVSAAEPAAPAASRPTGGQAHAAPNAAAEPPCRWPTPSASRPPSRPSRTPPSRSRR